VDIEQIKRFVQEMGGAIQAMRLYPSGHPSVQRQLAGCLSALSAMLERQEEIKLGVTQEMLFCEDYLFSQPGPAVDQLARLLQPLPAAGFAFRQGVSSRELEGFFSLLTTDGWQQHGLEETLENAGVECIVALDDEEHDPHKIYARALHVVADVCQDVRLGKIPSSVEAMGVVRTMVGATLKNPFALLALSMIRDYDNYTFNHSVNVAVIAVAVGRACGASDEEMRILGMGGLLHDLGKLKIDNRIINKPGRLTQQEFALIKKHPEYGASIAEEMNGISPEAVDIVLGHHLNFSRSGYPDDARGRQLSHLVDMATIADSYDAMTTLRSYRRPASPRQAIAEMRKEAGASLHPEYLQMFIDSLGPYPVGTMLRLDNNEVGLVTLVDPEEPERMQLKILFDEVGSPTAEPDLVELHGSEQKRIITEVDPFLFGVDLADHF